MRWWGRRTTKAQNPGLRRIDVVVQLKGIGATQVQFRIDCLGAVCPRPQMLTMRALDQMADGEVLELVVDNPSSAEAIPAIGLALESEHLGTVRQDDGWHVYMRKGYGSTRR